MCVCVCYVCACPLLSQSNACWWCSCEPLSCAASCCWQRPTACDTTIMDIIDAWWWSISLLFRFYVHLFAFSFLPFKWLAFQRLTFDSCFDVSSQRACITHALFHQRLFNASVSRAPYVEQRRQSVGCEETLLSFVYLHALRDGALLVRL